jgi:hypothetical protein
MSACTTSVPDLSTTLTGTTMSVPSVIEVKSGGSSRACARSDVVAFSRFIWTFLARLSAFAIQNQSASRACRSSTYPLRLTVQPCRRR